VYRVTGRELDPGQPWAVQSAHNKCGSEIWLSDGNRIKLAWSGQASLE